MNSLQNFIVNNGCIPSLKEIDEDDSMPHSSTYYKYFDNLNDAIIELGYNPKNSSKIRNSDEELLFILKELSDELGRQPTGVELKKYHNMSRNTYINRFGNWYKALSMAGVEFEKRSHSYEDSEIIEHWYIIKNEKGRIPTVEEMKDHPLNPYPAIFWRWGSYTDFLNRVGEDVNYNKYGCRVYLTDSGVKCFSLGELQVTQWLEENQLEFEKDVPYSDIIDGDGARRTFDWVVNHNDNRYFIEYFGINNVSSYDNNTDQKIQDCLDNDINLITLYSEDLKNPLSKVFSFLVPIAD